MYLHCSHMFLASQVDDYTEVGLFDHTLVLLLLAAPTELCGRCGRHNSPPAIVRVATSRKKRSLDFCGEL